MLFRVLAIGWLVLTQAVAHALQMAELMDRITAPQQTADIAMVRQLAIKAIQGFPGVDKCSKGHAKHAGLPDLGDVTLAQAALLTMPASEAADLLHSFAQQEQSYAESRRLALLGLSTFALQVCHQRQSCCTDQHSGNVLSGVLLKELLLSNFANADLPENHPCILQNL